MSIIIQLSDVEKREIEKKVLEKTAALRKSGRILKEEIFSILEDEATLLKYPITDDELCAFVCKKKNQLFVYINTHIPKEKQVFAAAHELYHIWFDRERLNEAEMLKSNILENDTQDIHELKANLFAAMLLVPKPALMDQLESWGVQKEKVDLEHIIRLMSIFLVPYKTIIRRLFEIDYISEKQLNSFLEIPDRNPKDGVLLQRKILQINDSSQERSEEIIFEGLVENAIKAFQSNLIDEKKFAYLLSLVKKSPADYGLALNENISDKEWESIMEDYDGDD